MIRLSTTTALITCMAAPTIAEVSAPDIWNGMSAFYQSVGLTVNATQTRAGNTTTISDLKFSADFPYDFGSIVITTTGFDLVENTDGTVTLVFPDNLPIALALTLPDEMFITARLDYQMNGYHSLASGQADDFTIQYTADSMTAKLTEFNGTDIPISAVEGTYTLTGMAGTSRFERRDMLTITQKYHVDKMEMAGGYSEAKTLSTVKMSQAWSDMAQESSITLPLTGIEFARISDQLRSGLSLAFQNSIGATIGEKTITRNGVVVGSEIASNENSATSLALSQDGLAIDAIGNNQIFDYLIEQLPFPIKGSFASFTGTFKIPLLREASEQEFTYAFSIDDFLMDESIWAQFDHDGKLPRDPASLKIYLSGAVTLFEDLLDIETMREAIEEGIKIAEPNSVTINNLDLAAIGGILTSKGVITFDNDNLDAMTGVPTATGTATINMSGLNAILDQLVEIGLVESDAAFGMRMGLGLFAVAGAEDDTLISELEFTPDGHISANGKRLK